MAKPGFYFIICPDPELIKRQITDLADKSGFSDARKFVFWGDEELGQDFWQELASADLFGQNRLLVVRRAHNLKAADLKKLATSLARGNSKILPVFCVESEWKKNSPSVPKILSKQKFWQFAEKKGWISRNPGLTPAGMGDFVRSWADENQVAADSRAVNSMCRALPVSATAASLELDKIELALGPDRVLLPEHAELIAPHADMDLFEFFNSLADKRKEPEVWKKVLKSHEEKDGLFFPLVANLTREARIYWMLSHGEEDQCKAHPYVKKLKTPVARRLGSARIARMFAIAVDAEFSVKAGLLSEEQALEFMVSELTSCFNG